MVDPVDFLEEKELLGFLHVNKTELSCMEAPQTFVSQLRDYGLVSREQHRKLIRMKSKEKIRSALYDILDSVETKGSNYIHRFWKCAFKETILNKYPTLKLLRNSLFDGSYQSECSQLEEDDDNTDPNVEDVPEKKGKEDKKGKRKRKSARDGDDDDNNEASTSSKITTPARKTRKKPCFSTPLKQGGNDDIWTWPIYKTVLPVTCGDLEASLNRDKLARAEKCIKMDDRWYTPTEFEKLAGKGASKNWKLSIYCRNTTIGKLIQDGHLKSIRFKKTSKANKSLFPSEETTTVSEQETEESGSDSSGRESSSDSTEEDEEENEELKRLKAEALHNPNRVLRVVCEDITGLLHTKRFASGTCGRSIRTDSSWLTPVEFAGEASCQTEVLWKKHIKCEGQPLGVLIKAKILEIHSLLCNCTLCHPNSEDMDNDKNDDECWICRSEGTDAAELVQCDECPRSFHQKCHLPNIQDALLHDKQLWMCTLCVFKRTVELYPERHRDEAMACSVSAHMLHCHYLLMALYRADTNCIFKSDPINLPDYRRVIQKPMWLDRVAVKLQDGRYQTVGDFVSDIQLIFSNCASYNRDTPDFGEIGERMKELFENDIKTVFKSLSS